LTDFGRLFAHSLTDFIGCAMLVGFQQNGEDRSLRRRDSTAF
jgi:hypothetical protein